MASIVVFSIILADNFGKIVLIKVINVAIKIATDKRTLNLGD